MAPGLIYVTKSRQVYFVTFYRSRAQIDRWQEFMQVDEVMSQVCNIQQIEKPYNDVGEPPEIDRGDKSDAFVLA